MTYARRRENVPQVHGLSDIPLVASNLSMANSNLTRLPVFGTTLDNAAATYNG
jgi:hypothetical protein